MRIFGEISVLTVIAVMLIASVFMIAFFGILYFSIHRKKSILMLFFANLFQLIVILFLYFEEITGDMGFLMMANLTNVLIVTLWINAIFLILEVRTKTTMLVGLVANAANLIQAFTIYLLTHSNHYVNILSALIIAVLSLYGAVKILTIKKEGRKKEVFYTTGIIILFSMLNFARVIYRLINPMYISSFSEITLSASIFLLIGLSFAFIMSFTVLFLSYNDLVLKVEKLSYTDTLTGTLTRRTFLLMLEQKLSEVRRGDRNMAVAMIDIDDFKRINDTYGHLTGDKVLEMFATSIKKGLRENDIIGRIGGEEFMVIIETDRSEDALVALERIKSNISGVEFVKGEKITFSCGYMMIDKQKSNLQINNIMKTVDKKMYLAKSQGKNRIVG